jgi:hypothetical protein
MHAAMMKWSIMMMQGKIARVATLSRFAAAVLLVL